MKLNADIVYSELSKRYAAEFHKTGDDGLTLGKPELYMEDDCAFLEHHLYLATVEHLPPRPRIQQNVVLVCIGDALKLGYYKERLNLILIKDRADFFKVFRTLQELFDTYEAWERSLYRTLLGNADVASMVDDSARLFGTQIYVMDRAFRFIAISEGARTADLMRQNSRTLTAESLSRYLNTEQMMTEKEKAFTLNVEGRRTLCVNLFSKTNEYEGCLWFDLDGADLPSGFERLAEFLADMIEAVIERNPHLKNDMQTAVKRLVQTLAEEQPLTKSQRVMLGSINKMQAYVCVYFANSEPYQKIPPSFICGAFEELLENSFAFLYGGDVVGLVGIKKREGGAVNVELVSKLRGFCDQMRLSAGVSGEFDDLFSIRLYLMQAQSALEDGRMLNAGDSLFFFSSYALTELIINSLGELPTEAYFPDGLKTVLEHDANAKVSYLETIRAFLDENLSYTATAKRLYVHRTTLIDRIERIERETGIDLKDNNQRLLIEILLRAMDLEEVIRRK